MSDVLSLETLPLFLVFIVPGFVAMKTHELMVASDRRSAGDSIIEIVTYSMVNLALLSWAVILLHQGGFPEDHPVSYAFGMFGVLFVGPVLLAIAVRFARRWPWLCRHLLHPAPTAWDLLFDRREHLWVLCHLKSGGFVGGIYSDRSASSNYPYPQDLYVETTWHVDDEGAFVAPVEQTAGLLIRADECRFIEFFNTKPEASGDG